ncbi:hypothetical protein GCM10010405_42240 [Streptomyces macrosporus]|uniref:Lipoprotein n=2 Tax=Streptomyces macrosporus TaxID=44032 RepID=A0ABN3KA60_9ACTN
MTGMNRAAAAVVGLVVFAVPAVVGCSSSPKQELIESTDERCRTINERFAGDLAYGEGIGVESVSKLRERVALLKDLRSHVRKMPKPETGRAELNGWLDKLGEYITGLDDLRSQLQNYRPGMDLVVILQAGVNHDAAKAVGSAAKRFGFEDCAQTRKWEHIAS